MSALKKKSSEPPKTEAELKRAIDRYFKSCEGTAAKDTEGNPVFNKSGIPIYERSPVSPTITGLALAVGLESRQAVLQYPYDDKRAKLIRRGVARVEEFAERQLIESGTAGVKFFLSRSFSGWGEDNERDESSLLAGMSDEKLAEYIEKLGADAD